MSNEELEPEAEGIQTMRYGRVEAWAKEFDIGIHVMRVRLAVLEGIRAEIYEGEKTAIGYAEDEVRALCKDIIGLPHADKDGFIYIEGKRHASKPTWSDLLNCSEQFFDKKMEGVIGITGWHQSGPLLKNGFFEEGVVQEKIKRNLLNDKGVVVLDNKEAVGLRLYGSSTLGLSSTTFQKYVNAAKLEPIPNVEVYSKKMPIPVYWKNEVDAALPWKIYELDDGETEIEIDGRKAVSIMKINNTNTTISHRYSLISENGVEPISNIRVRAGKRLAKLFWKDEVEGAIPKYLLLENGETCIDGRMAIAIYPFAKLKNERPPTLQSIVDEVGLQPIGIIGKSLNGPEQPLYWKDDIEKLLPRILDDKWEAIIDGKIAVWRNGYGLIRGIKGDTMRKYIKLANLQPIKAIYGRANKKPVRLYWKDEIEKVLPDNLGGVAIELYQGEEISLDDNGIGEYQGVKVINRMPYASFVGTSNSTLSTWIRDAELKPVSGAVGIRGTRKFNLYRKDEVDVLVTQIKESKTKWESSRK